MRTRVTAVLVAQRGGDWLDETIAGLAAQTHAPSAIVVVNNGGGAKVGEQLLTSGADHVLDLPVRLAFGQAVHRAAEIAAVEYPLDEEWLWLLTEDSCPDSDALEHIVSSVQRAPSVVVAGPKLVDWDRPDRIIELGQSLTRYGTRWMLRRQELDQQQYDHLQDVLGVGPVGMLVRRDVWQQLGGFDPAHPVYDDGLDFCVRARLAGYRIEVAPASRVRFARSGVGGPHIDRRRSVLRTSHRQARTSQLHRRVTYAPPGIAFFEWLWLPIYAVLRMLWALLREQPGNMLGELVSGFAVFFRPHLILASRRKLKANDSAGWAAIRPLRVDPKTVRTARLIDREAILAATGRQRRELHFVSTGGLAVLTIAIAIAVACTWWAFAHTSLFGGGMAPLSSIGELWRNTRTLDGEPADPFTWVLALLGSLTFWNPSHALVLVLILAIPLTALGGWIWGAQLTESKAGRALVGLGFALSPVLLDSISGGRLPTLIVGVTLPWLLIAATRSRESWSWAGTASLLAAVVLASAPILLPLAIIMLVVGIATSWRGAARVLTTGLATAVLFAPKVVTALLQGRPLDIVLDPGITSAYEPGSTWHMLLGFPEFGLEGWGNIFADLGLGVMPATLLVGVLMLPIALLALLGLFTGRVVTTLLTALLGGLGMVTALISAQLYIGMQGSEVIAVWAGPGIAVYWLAILSLGAVGASALSRAAVPVVSVAVLAALVAVAPLATQLAMGNTPMRDGSTQMPALVRAAGETDPGLHTLVITAEGHQAVRVQDVTGTGGRLDQMRTQANHSEATERDLVLAELVGGLASTGGEDLTEQLKAERIGFVLLNEGGDEAERAELQRVFDQHTSLTSAGLTKQGLLWRVTDTGTGADTVGDTEMVLEGTSFTGNSIWAIQLAVLFALFLLALPIGEVVERPERRKRPSRKKKAKTKRPVAAAPAAPASGGAVPAAAVETGEPEVTGSPEVTTAPEMTAAPEVTAAPEIPVVPEAFEVPGIPVVYEIPEAPELPGIAEIPPAPEVIEVAELLEVPEPPGATQRTEVAEASEVPEAPGAPEDSTAGAKPTGSTEPTEKGDHA